MECRQSAVGMELKFQVVGMELKFPVKSIHSTFIKNESVCQTAKAPRRQGLFSLTPTFDFTHAIITGRSFLLLYTDVILLCSIRKVFYINMYMYSLNISIHYKYIMIITYLCNIIMFYT